MQQAHSSDFSRPCGRNAYARAHMPARTADFTPLNVLVACEESQAETMAFRELGHNAFSCDLLPCRVGGRPEWHILSDVSPYLGGLCEFVTADGQSHCLDHWDLIIAHPPCTYLCRVSSVHLMAAPDGWRLTCAGWKHLNVDRWNKLRAARSFFYTCLNANAPYVAVENPIPMRVAELPRPDAYACPSWFGVKYTKKTLYWLRNLPPLFAFLEYPCPKCFVTYSRSKYRSRTFPELAWALAVQWSTFILDDYKAKRGRP